MGYLILIAVVVFGLYTCTGGDFGTDRIFGPPDTLPLERYEDLDVGVWFYFNDSDRSEFLGDVRGASACGSAAYSHADRLNLASDDWSYVCCTHEAGSDCYRKIR